MAFVVIFNDSLSFDDESAVNAMTDRYFGE